MKLYITGGGTGGHVTPGLAIAKYCQQKRPDTVVRFAGTSGGIESRLVPREGYPLDIIEISGLRRSFKPDAIMHNFKAVKQTLTAQIQAKKLLDMGAKAVCVSMSQDGAVFVSKEEKEALYVNSNPKIETCGAVGTGDAMVGAIANSMENGLSFVELAKYTVATGRACARLAGTEMATLKRVFEVYETLEVYTV